VRVALPVDEREARRIQAHRAIGAVADRDAHGHGVADGRHLAEIEPRPHGIERLHEHLQPALLRRHHFVGLLHERLEAVAEGPAELVVTRDESLLDRLQHRAAGRAADHDARAARLSVRTRLRALDHARLLHRRLDEPRDRVAEGHHGSMRDLRGAIAREPGAFDRVLRRWRAADQQEDHGEEDPAHRRLWYIESAVIVHTLGHSTLALDAFLERLAGHGIAGIADVRRFPMSRRHPHFAREALAQALDGGGVAYDWLPELGGRRNARPDSPNVGWRVEGFRGYADHMESAEFASGLERLLALAAHRPTAVLCAEAVPWRCHRQLLADALVVRGVEVRHVTGPAAAQVHRLTPFARVDGTRLVYDGATQQSLPGVATAPSGGRSAGRRT
jgi:hypothetical protein